MHYILYVVVQGCMCQSVLFRHLRSPSLALFVLLWMRFFSCSIFTHRQIEYNDLEATLEKLKSQCPTIELPEAANQLDFDENSFPDAIKPLNDTSTSSMMDIPRLVTHLTQAVVAARERVAALLQELHPLKERVAMLQDDCEEKKKVSTATAASLLTPSSTAQRIPSAGLPQMWWPSEMGK